MLTRDPTLAAIAFEAEEEEPPKPVAKAPAAFAAPAPAATPARPSVPAAKPAASGIFGGTPAGEGTHSSRTRAASSRRLGGQKSMHSSFSILFILFLDGCWACG